MFVLLFCVSFLLVACREEKENVSYYVIEDVVNFPEIEKEEENLLTADKTIFKLFYPDVTGQVMLTKMIEVEEINKNTISEHMVELAYLDEAIRILELTGEVKEEGVFLTVNFSRELLYVLEAEEEEKRQLILACLVNTLIDAYEASAVEVFIAGEDESQGQYSKFKLSEAEEMTQEVNIQGEIREISYQRFYAEDGYSMFFEVDNYTAEYVQTEGLVVFESLDFTNSISIYESESSRRDMVQILLEQEEFGLITEIDSEDIEVGTGLYEATLIYKRGRDYIYNYYVVENESQVFVIEVRMNVETATEQESHILHMIDTFQIWN